MKPTMLRPVNWWDNGNFLYMRSTTLFPVTGYSDSRDVVHNRLAWVAAVHYLKTKSAGGWRFLERGAL